MNREDGTLNKLFAVNKGQLVDFYNFNTFKDGDDLEEMDEEKLRDILKHTEEESRKKVVYMPNGEIHRVG
jgi:hypothetical protein